MSDLDIEQAHRDLDELKKQMRIALASKKQAEYFRREFLRIRAENGGLRDALEGVEGKILELRKKVRQAKADNLSLEEPARLPSGVESELEEIFSILKEGIGKARAESEEGF